MSEKSTQRLIWFVVVSAIAHFSVYFSLGQWSRSSRTDVGQQIVEIDYLPQSKKLSKLQLVEQDERRLNEDMPEDARFMGRHNQRVVKETRAALSGDFRNTSNKGNDSTANKPRETAQKPKAAQRTQSLSGIPTLAALSPTLDISRQRNEGEEVQHSSRGPASATNDYLKDVKPNMETMLNTREFVYYTYYQRIRAQLRQYWEPSIRDKVKKIFAQGRSIASTSDHITRVYIILDKDGSLLKVQVIEKSGVFDLDDAAVEAFRAAEPFPNPPEGMIEPDGTIKIRWDFILEA